MKTSRRTFLATVGTALPALPLAAQTPAPAAKLTGLIDCQSHLFCPELLALMETRATDPVVFTRDGTRFLRMGDWLRKVPPLYLDVDAKLAAMDAAGIALTALSINDPGPEWFGDDGPAVARIANDYIAGLAKKHPARFFGLCVLPWQNPAAALDELNRCATQLGNRGLLLYTNLAGRFPDKADFRPVLRRCAELGLPVLLHPAKPVTTEFVKEYEMTSTLGNMFENTIALTRLIMSGVLDELPQLKLVCPHLGGTLPYIIGRLDHQVTVLKRGPRNLKHKPSDYLRRIWFDVVSPLPEAITFARDLVGADRLLFASDHPWVQPEVILQALSAAKLTAAETAQIASTNARKLFGLA
jgi:predicted TIM-barrel fold metal-dependent hydrolase